jgi:hypothetical protein
MLTVLASVCRGNKCSVNVACAGKLNISWLIAYQQCAHDLRWRGGKINNAHTVRKKIDNPYFTIISRDDRNRLHTYRHRCGFGQRSVRDREDFKVVVWRVDRQQCAPVGGQCHRPDRASLEGDEIDRRHCHRRRHCQYRAEQQHETRRRSTHQGHYVPNVSFCGWHGISFIFFIFFISRRIQARPI